MAYQIPVPVSPEVFARLQKLAIPLVDDSNAVIERLLNHWEGHPPGSEAPVQTMPERTIAVWRSPRGDVLPVGASLQAPYAGQTFRAYVEKGGIRFNGELYSNLTAAGVAAKGSVGKTGRGASTNGRIFWRIKNPTTQQWVAVAALRPNAPVDVQVMLDEIDQL